MKIASGLFRQARDLARSLLRLPAAGERGVAADAKRRNGRGSLLRGEEGNAIVEMALTAPVLLAILTGIITFSIAYSNQLTLTQAVGVAGQALSQSRLTTTDPCATTFTALTNAAPTLKSTSINFTITMNGTSYTQTTCSGAQTALGEGNVPVSVYATYPCNLAVYGIKFLTSCTLAARVAENAY